MIYASNFGTDSHLNPIPSSPSPGFPGPPNGGLEAAGISGEDISSFMRNLLVPGFGSSGIRGNFDPFPSLVGDKDLLTEREELSLDVSK